MSPLRWYFDFISPFSYLQLRRFGELPDGANVDYVPILFAGLLGHWGQKGPAEIPPKRTFTYRFLQWYAEKHGIPYRMPPAHPFNPLKALRLCVALGSTAEAVRAIFDFIWAEGRTLDGEDWQALCERLQVDDGDGLIAAQTVKDTLRRNTEGAAAGGVFGVPTFDIDGHLFWGVDATEMVIDYLNRPRMFESEEMKRVSDLPVGVARKA
ncbi:MAG: 2-hydroxychromene-2-carboxylate isomerase [Gammaproteobacteria bacterium]|nr:2-hydroxychromene-2-carboxylate isomerase [Gammaproteobacteria bacterium]